MRRNCRGGIGLSASRKCRYIIRTAGIRSRAGRFAIVTCARSNLRYTARLAITPSCMSTPSFARGPGLGVAGKMTAIDCTLSLGKHGSRSLVA